MRAHTAMTPRLSLVIAAATVLTLATITGCDDLPSGDKTSPYFWSELFLNKYASELVVGDLEEGPTPLVEPRAVLLITGVTISEEWFGPIVARLERDGFVPYVYVPPALLSGSLFQNSADLADVVEQVREQSGQDKIDILAECTGGVIARHYIQSLGGDQYVSRLVTFVSPHNGIDKAPMAAAIAGWPALYDLSPGSAFLEAVNGVPLPEGVAVTSIYTCGDEYIRPWQTSVVPGATNIGLCDEFVGHFQTFYDPAIYLIMHAALTSPVPGDAAEWNGGDPASGAEGTQGETGGEDGPSGGQGTPGIGAPEEQAAVGEESTVPGATDPGGAATDKVGTTAPVESPEPVQAVAPSTLPATSSVTIPSGSAGAAGCGAGGRAPSGALALIMVALLAGRRRLTSLREAASVASR
ncbi:MAG: hypothetical protein AMXMBFR64_12430 [Myxococcales bacterium]